MTAVVVTADDFGLCAAIDNAICRLHDCGVVRRASLVVNTPHFEESVKAVKTRPDLQLAIHLNLTDGAPVLPARTVPTLVGRDGCFPGGRHYAVIAGILGGRISRREIHAEWRAQIAKARDAGVRLHELNSHGHLHLLPPLHDIVVQVRREFDIPRVRLVRSSEWPRGVLLHLCSRRLLQKLKRDRVLAALPDRTLGLRSPGAVDPRITLSGLAIRDAAGVELIVHPSQGANEYHTRWGYAGTDVLNWLLGAAPHP